MRRRGARFEIRSKAAAAAAAAAAVAEVEAVGVAVAAVAAAVAALRRRRCTGYSPHSACRPLRPFVSTCSIGRCDP